MTIVDFRSSTNLLETLFCPVVYLSLRRRLLVLSRSMILAMLVMLLVSTPIVSSSPSDKPLHQKKAPSLSDNLNAISEDIGRLIFEEAFQDSPSGFNETQWNFIAINDPSITWTGGEQLNLWGESYSSALLRSRTVFEPGVILELNVSFTQGTCYTLFGWCDEWQDEAGEWIANGRQCENGVFIDCWDGELFLVTYCDGERSVTRIVCDDVNGWRIVRIEWTESLVRLEINEISAAFVSQTIPKTPLPLTFIVSGHHGKAEPGRLSLESLLLYQYERNDTSMDPEITLLWPENNSIVYPGELIDFEVRGSKGNLTFSWEMAHKYRVESPWDVPVPCVIVPDVNDFPVLLHLSVEAESNEEHHSSFIFTFQIDNHVHYLDARFMSEEPVVDGILDENEVDLASQYTASFLSECNEKVNVNMLVGHTSDSLYIAFESPIPDSYHSRTTLFLDADADREWSNNLSDIGITIASPNANTDYTCVFGAFEESPSNLVCDALGNDGVVTYEFVIPLTCFNSSREDGIGFGIQLSHGGYDLTYPVKNLTSLVCSLYLLDPVFHMGQTISIGIVLILVCVSVAVPIYLSRKENFTFEQRLHDENLERIKILLLSHQQLDESRLARMMNMELHVVEPLVEELLARGFPASRIDGIIVRSQIIEENG